MNVTMNFRSWTRVIMTLRIPAALLSTHIYPSNRLNSFPAFRTIAFGWSRCLLGGWESIVNRNWMLYELETRCSSLPFVFHFLLNSLVNDTLQALEDGGCLRVNEDNTVESLVMGAVASQYYLHYTTVALFSANIRADTSLEVRSLIKSSSFNLCFILLYKWTHEVSLFPICKMFVPWYFQSKSSW